MKIILPQSKLLSEVEFLRRLGYHFHRDPVTLKESWSRRLSDSHYPRFHIYVNASQDSFIFDLHLDQKKPSYEGSHAHAGEYDGPLVEAEAARLKGAGEGRLPSLPGVPLPRAVQEPQSWWQRLFS